MGGQTGIPFWAHTIVVFFIGSFVYNPTGWCLLNNGQATGGGGDAVLWAALIGTGVFLIFYGIPLYDAIRKGDGFKGHAVIVTAVFLFIGLLIVTKGLLVVETGADAIWAAMVWASMIAGLGKYEAAGAEG